ncbi:hypothetical protein WMY93_028886 [Mugilogobius chulae]|uniref:CUB domain-containing protein n=1 Tax=Mugilogobius chulae TaxID=88201 RepID=A0AAW0MPN2_9GOBI
MQSPVSCHMNLTGPEGFIEAPPQSSSSFLSTKDCTYTITVYMGYGVEVQVMNVNLSAGDKVVFEDEGRGENSMLANETILMRGLVVRSHSNQLAIRFHSSRPEPGKVLLRYQDTPPSPPRSASLWCGSLGVIGGDRLQKDGPVCAGQFPSVTRFKVANTKPRDVNAASAERRWKGLYKGVSSLVTCAEPGDTAPCCLLLSPAAQSSSQCKHHSQVKQEEALLFCSRSTLRISAFGSDARGQDAHLSPPQ